MPHRRSPQPWEQELRRLAPALDSVAAPQPSPELVEGTLRAARSELARPAPQAAPIRVSPAIPVGFKRELARLLGVASAPLALALLWNALVISLAMSVLEAWIPETLAFTLVAAYALGSLGWLGLAFGSLPFVAHRRALERRREAA